MSDEKEVSLCGNMGEWLGVFLHQYPSERVVSALALAQGIHEHDRRKSGEPYISHCVAVATILGEWGGDEDEIVAALLHDTVEDHPHAIGLSDIERLFGKRVRSLVDGATKFRDENQREDDAATLHKIVEATSIEPGVALIKLADRLHNMETIGSMPREKQVEKAKETLAVYVPLAESLGLWKIKNLLADISWQIVQPELFSQVKEEIDADPRRSSEFVAETKKRLEDLLRANGFEAEVSCQFGGYHEMAEKRKSSMTSESGMPRGFEDISDVVSFRIVLSGDNEEETVKKCYTVLGVVRMGLRWECEERRSDDFFAGKSPNGYSALQDVFRSPSGLVEVAITTRRREDYNVWGVLKVPLHEREDIKRIFTPKGEMFFVQQGDTAIDIAYVINPDLARRATGVKINGVLCDLSCVVPDSAEIEIVVGDGEAVQENWLLFCHGEKTRRHIEEDLRIEEAKRRRRESEALLVERVLRKRGLLDIDDLDAELVKKLTLFLGCWSGPEALYRKIAEMKRGTLEPLWRLIEEKLDDLGVREGEYTTVLIRGENELDVLSKIWSILGPLGEKTKTEMESENGSFLIKVVQRGLDSEKKKALQENLVKGGFECEVV